MGRIVWEKDDNGSERVEISGCSSMVEKGDDGMFRVEFSTGAGRLSARLDQAGLRVLALQAGAFFPPGERVSEEGWDAVREGVRDIAEIDDRSAQLLIRELQSDDLIDCLWFAKSMGLTELIVRNMSSRAAEMLVDDMARRWGGKDPDKAKRLERERGRAACSEVFKIAMRLADESQIPKFLREEADVLRGGTEGGDGK